MGAILVITGLLVWKNSFATFDFYDMSGFMDSGFRILKGQTVYKDFYFGAGPVQFYLHALSFWIFGFGRSAVVFHLLAGHVVFVCLLFFFSRRFLSLKITTLVTLFGGISFYAPIAFPWYDQNAAICLMLAYAALFLFKLPSVFLGGVFLALAFHTKSNLGIAGSAVLIAGLWISGNREVKAVRNTLALLISMTLTILVPLFAVGLWDEYFYQNFLALDYKARLSSWPRIIDYLSYSPIFFISAVSLLVTALAFETMDRSGKLASSLNLGVMATAAFSIITGSLFIPANLVFVGPLLALTHVIENQIPRGRRKKAGKMLLAILYVMLSVELIPVLSRPTAWMWNPENSAYEYPLRSGPLAGWYSNAEMGSGLDWSVEYIHQNIPRNESIFVFPCSTVIYGLTDREGYKPGTTFFALEISPSPKLKDVFARNFRENPPDWIVLVLQPIEFYNADKLLTWLDLKDFVGENYQSAASSGRYHILKKVPPPASVSQSR